MISLAKSQYFTNLEFPEIRERPFQKATFWWKSVVWGRYNLTYYLKKLWITSHSNYHQFFFSKTKFDPNKIIAPCHLSIDRILSEVVSQGISRSGRKEGFGLDGFFRDKNDDVFLVVVSAVTFFRDGYLVGWLKQPLWKIYVKNGSVPQGSGWK